MQDQTCGDDLFCFFSGADLKSMYTHSSQIGDNKCSIFTAVKFCSEISKQRNT